MSMKKGFGMMAMMAAMMMGGGVSGPPSYREKERRKIHTAFILRPEVPKGHDIDQIDFTLEINNHNISGSIDFTFVRNNKTSYAKRSAARLREVIRYFKETPIEKLKEFNQFKIAPKEAPM